MGHNYGTKWALVFGKLVPFFAKSGVEVGRSRDFFYYGFLMVFLCVCYQFLIEFNKNSYVNLLIIKILGVEVLRSIGKFGCGALFLT